MCSNNQQYQKLAICCTEGCLNKQLVKHPFWLLFFVASIEQPLFDALPLSRHGLASSVKSFNACSKPSLYCPKHLIYSTSITLCNNPNLNTTTIWHISIFLLQRTRQSMFDYMFKTIFITRRFDTCFNMEKNLNIVQYLKLLDNFSFCYIFVITVFIHVKFKFIMRYK